MCCFVVASPSWQKKRYQYIGINSLCDITKGLKCKRKTHGNTHMQEIHSQWQTLTANSMLQISNIILHSNLKTDKIKRQNTHAEVQLPSVPLSLFDLLQKNKSSSSSLSSSSNAQLQSFRPNSSNLKQHEVHRRGQNTLTERPTAAC